MNIYPHAGGEDSRTLFLGGEPDAEAAGKNAVRLEIFGRLVAQVLRIRMVGSAAIDLAWVAEGRFDASIILGSHLWDLAGGTAIAREAGARVINTELGVSPITIASSSRVLHQLAEAIDLAATVTP